MKYAVIKVAGTPILGIIHNCFSALLLNKIFCNSKLMFPIIKIILGAGWVYVGCTTS